MSHCTIIHRATQATSWAALLLMVAAGGCKKPELEPVPAMTIAGAAGDNALPIVQTLEAAKIPNTDSVRVTGMLVRHGNSWVAERGICFGTGPLPVADPGHILPYHAPNEHAVGEFAVTIYAPEGLYVRAYATNTDGTAYGRVLLVTDVKITTRMVSDTADTSVRVYGNAEGMGLGEKGVWFSDVVNADPVAQGTRVSGGSGAGTYSVVLTGLSPMTTYVARAYVRDAEGKVVYGEPLTFKTRRCPPTMQDASGNEYHVVEINGKCWMRENLRTTKYSNGGDIPPASCTGTSGGYFVPQGDGIDPTWYGLLYNHYACMDSRMLCPTGWEVPSTQQWNDLIDGNPAKLRSFGWESSDSTAVFNGIPAGECACPGDQYEGRFYHAYWWTRGEAQGKGIGYDLDGNGISQDTVSLSTGRSVRCIKKE